MKRGCNAPDRKKLYPDEGSAIDREATSLSEVFMEASDWPLVMQKPLLERLLLLYLPKLSRGPGYESFLYIIRGLLCKGYLEKIQRREFLPIPIFARTLGLTS